MACPVRSNCLAPTACPYCVGGSEYRPRDRRVAFPDRVAAAQAQQAARRARRAAPGGARARRSVRKGKQGEREFAKLSGGQRVPGSGAFEGLPNDIRWVPVPGTALRWRAESKRWARIAGWPYRWLDAADVVAFRTPDTPWLFAVRWDTFAVGAPPGLAAWVADPHDGVVLGRWHCRARVRAGGVAQLWAFLHHKRPDLLVVRADRRPWLVVLDQAHAQAWAAGGSASAGTSP